MREDRGKFSPDLAGQIRSVDPSDPFRWSRASTRAELGRYRLSVIESSDRLGKITEFTCDNCADAAWCTLAFDPYNTDGDCLASK